MRRLNKILVVLFIVTSSLISCKNKAQDSLKIVNSEFELLVQYLEENGNFINSELAPALILADEIDKNKNDNKYLVLDIRSESSFKSGHIEYAKNVKAAELLNYFENKITPSNYDKINIVCYSGQSAAYYTSLLRLAGYNNVFNLKWGISSWTKDEAAKYWGKNSTNKYANKLETTANPMPEKGEFPLINTGKTTGKEILNARIKEIIAKPYREFYLKADTIFKNPGNFHIVNYVNEEKYNFGHIKGAVRYQPNGSLSSTTNLYTLPTDKKVLVSGITGLSAAYVVAYLNVLGYDVSNLAYGANSYMNSTLIKNEWDGFNKKEIKNYELYDMNAFAVVKPKIVVKHKAKKVITVKKKKKAPAEGGC